VGRGESGRLCWRAQQGPLDGQAVTVIYGGSAVGHRMKKTGIVLVSVLFLSSCERDRVVLNDFGTIGEGESRAYRIETAGIYRLEMTASKDGAGVEWVGETCQGVREAKSFNGICEYRSEGQIVISNPTTFGMGSDTTVTVKVTKIARASSASQQ